MSDVGITALGAYIPYYYIKRETIGAAWGARGQKGVRSLANSDEDSITMAVAAVRKCFGRVARESTNALYFATTTSPYAEKSGAAIIATACDLGEDAFVSDLGGSLKCGTNALRAALDAAGRGERSLVATADCRNAYPKSADEQLFGDAAAAVAVGSVGVLARFEASYSVNAEITDVWRNAGEKFLNTAEQRFRLDEGYQAAMGKAVSGLMKKAGLTPEAVQRVILATPGMRDHEKLAGRLGFTPGQVEPAMLAEVGACGCAQPLLLLVRAVLTAKPGDRLLLASYGQGADAFLFTVTDEADRLTEAERRQIDVQLSARKELKDYGRFLSFRGIVEAVPGEPFKIPASTAQSWREQNTYLRLKGSRCNRCGAEIYPAHRVCHSCRVKDDFTLINLSGETTRLFTYSIDKLAGRSDDPVVVQAVAEAEGGARVYLNMTDFDPEQVEIGMELQFTFRKINTLGHFNNYYWKFRPMRG